MEAGLVISPRFAAKAATANASFEKAHNGNLIEFPAFELRNFAMREPIFSEGEASAYFFNRRHRRTSPSRGVHSTAAMFHEVHRLRDLATSLGRKTAAERLTGFLLAMTPDDAEGGGADRAHPARLPPGNSRSPRTGRGDGLPQFHAVEAKRLHPGRRQFWADNPRSWRSAADRGGTCAAGLFDVIQDASFSGWVGVRREGGRGAASRRISHPFTCAYVSPIEGRSDSARSGRNIYGRDAEAEFGKDSRWTG